MTWAAFSDGTFVGLLAVNGCYELVGDKSRTETVRDWCDFGVPRTTRPPTSEKAADIDASAVEVDIAHTQGSRLAPAQAGVCEHQHEQAPGSGRGGQRKNLGVREVDVVRALRPGQAQTASGVEADAAASQRRGPLRRIRRTRSDGRGQVRMRAANLRRLRDLPEQADTLSFQSRSRGSPRGQRLWPAR